MTLLRILFQTLCSHCIYGLLYFFLRINTLEGREYKSESPGIPSGKIFLLSRSFLSFIEYLPESILFFRETKLKNSDWL
jgi:hypothetical protein